MIVVAYNLLNKIRIHKYIQTINKNGKPVITVEYKLINIRGMIILENHHIAASTAIIN